MSEMIERGIDALIANFKATVEANSTMFGVIQLTKVQVPPRAAFRPMVVAVVKAMREPTAAMIEAGWNAAGDQPQTHWEAMIDAVLDETQKP